MRRTKPLRVPYLQKNWQRELVHFSSSVSQGRRSAWYVSNHFYVPISFELTRSRAQSIAGAIYEGSVSRNLLQGGSLVSQSAQTDFHSVTIAVGAIRVCSVQIAARFLANVNPTSHTQDVWIMCAPCLGCALLVRSALAIVDWSTLMFVHSCHYSRAPLRCQHPPHLQVQIHRERIKMLKNQRDSHP
jgi:hypothetical protein